MTTLILFAAAAAAAASPQFLADVSSTLNDYNYSEDRAGRTAVFARSQADFADARIMVRERRRGHWSPPGPIGFTDPRYSDSDPWLTPDGKTLYFISNRPMAGTAPKTDTDIWRSRRTASGWSAPEHLGAINSNGPELGVELHGDTLYFSSVRKGGQGGLDIYAARSTLNGFASPEPVAGPFNSSQSDSDFTLSRDGRIAAFWRSAGSTAKIHVAYRQAAGWSDPVPLGDMLNSGPFNFTPSFSSDGRSLWFASTRIRPGQEEGMADIFIAKLPRAPK